jgi:hypothetical protein
MNTITNRLHLDFNNLRGWICLRDEALSHQSFAQLPQRGGMLVIE